MGYCITIKCKNKLGLYVFLHGPSGAAKWEAKRAETSLDHPISSKIYEIIFVFKFYFLEIL